MAQDELSKNAPYCKKKFAQVVSVQIILHFEADFILKDCITF
jgi:hypothetical protein